MENDISRDDLKYNFLRRVIIRIDYAGVLDIELEETVKALKEHLHDVGFVKFGEGYINEVDFEIKDPELIETQLAIPISELKKNKSFNFATEDMSQTVQITKFFTLINVDFGKYIKFEAFGKIFSEIVKIIKCKNKFVRILRIGLRKINHCFLLDISKLNEYFNEKHFNNSAENLNIADITIDLSNSQKIDSFSIGDRDVNLIRFLSQGIINKDGDEKQAYQVVLDIDVYTKDEELFDKIIEDSEKTNDEIIKMNDIVFKIYVQMLKNEFITKLKTTGVNEDVILGVEKND